MPKKFSKPLIAVLLVVGVTISVVFSDSVGSVLGDLTFECEEGFECARVEKVVDGDTIVLDGGLRLRYIGIDTPESVKPNTPVECFAKESSKFNEKLVKGEFVKMQKDVNNTDRYGRLLRYVWVDDVFVNEYLVREGYAKAVSYPPDVKYQDLFREAERDARENNRGLWNLCSYSN